MLFGNQLNIFRNAKKHGVTELIQAVTKDFGRRLGLMEDKYTALLTNFCNEQGKSFSDLWFTELLDILCLDPSNRRGREPSEAFQIHLDHDMLNHIRKNMKDFELKHKKAFVKSSPREKYIRCFKVMIELALITMDEIYEAKMQHMINRFANQSPAQD